jgi:hypothetical protein
LLCKSVEFNNMFGQKIKVIEIPVLEKNNNYYFMAQVRLQKLISTLNHKPQEKSSYSFREYLKRKMSWHDFNDLFSIKEFKNDA